MGKIERIHSVTADQYEQAKQEWDVHIKESKALDQKIKNLAMSWAVPRLVGLLAVYLLLYLSLNYVGILPWWSNQLTLRYVLAAFVLPISVCFPILYCIGVARQSELSEKSAYHIKEADRIFDEANREEDVIYITDDGKPISMNCIVSGGYKYRYNKYNLDGSFRQDFRRPR